MENISKSLQSTPSSDDLFGMMYSSNRGKKFIP